MEGHLIAQYKTILLKAVLQISVSQDQQKKWEFVFKNNLRPVYM